MQKNIHFLYVVDREKSVADSIVLQEIVSENVLYEILKELCKPIYKLSIDICKLPINIKTNEKGFERVKKIFKEHQL